MKMIELEPVLPEQKNPHSIAGFFGYLILISVSLALWKYFTPDHALLFVGIAIYDKVEPRA